MPLLELDGSFGEGGGQILRTSLSLALLSGRGFHLRNVRAGRPKPGLQPQHLMSVRSAGQIGDAQMRGASLGSSDLVFEPGKVRHGKYRFDIGTAGATGLVLHTLYLPLILGATGPSELILTGGTHVSTSPCFHFLDVTWRSYLAALGLQLRLEMKRPGFYPRGGGEVHVFLQPATEVQPLCLLERGPVRITGFSAVAGLPDHIAHRQARRLKVRLEQNKLRAAIDEETWEGGPGSVLAAILDTRPALTLFFALGERGKPAERVADDVLDEVLGYLAAGEQHAVDAHSADQLVVPLALAKGTSEYTTACVTRHLTTNVAVIRQFLDRDIVCEGEEGQPGRVRIA